MRFSNETGCTQNTLGGTCNSLTIFTLEDRISVKTMKGVGRKLESLAIMNKTLSNVQGDMRKPLVEKKQFLLSTGQRGIRIMEDAEDTTPIRDRLKGLVNRKGIKTKGGRRDQIDFRVTGHGGYWHFKRGDKRSERHKI